jgi:5-methylcytosine-specific restriction protein A
MQYIASRGFTFPQSPAGLADELWFNLWQHKLRPYGELAAGDIIYWYERPTQKIVWKSCVTDIEKFSYDTKADVQKRLVGRFGDFDLTQPYYVEAPDRGYCLAWKVQPLERMSLPKPESLRFPQHGWLRVDLEITAKWLTELRGEAEFIQGKTYNRSDLHDLYGGQQQGGISTPAHHGFIMLFTGEQGEQYGYKDGWTDDGIFFYTGEGQVGDMTFMRGNRAIRDHADEGKDLHLFEYVRKGHAQYLGQMVCTGFHERQAPDIQGAQRKVIVFELTPVTAFDSLEVDASTEEQNLWTEPLSTLRQRALATSGEARSPSERKQLVHYRSSAVRTYVLKRADGVCEACGKEAPFQTDKGRPYLEPHYIRRLSDGGPDDPNWVIALCPNCHRRAHYSEDKKTFTQHLVDVVQEKERQLTS